MDIGASLNENFLKDSVKPFSFENLEKYYEWISKPTGCHLLDDINNEYTYEKIFNLWLEGKSITSIIGNPISIHQYSKALMEYAKYGQFMHFPEKEVYNMVRSAIRKSVVISKISAMFCVFKYLPYDFVKNTLIPYYSEFVNEKVELADSGYTFTYTTDYDKLRKRYNLPDGFSLKQLKKAASPEYTLFRPSEKRFKNIEFINDFSSGFYSCQNRIALNTDFWYKIFPYRVCNSYPIIELTYNDDKTVTVKATTFLILSDIGFLNTFNNLTSEQVGLSYIYYYLKLLNDDMTSEELIVWLNKIVNIYHFRGDISEHLVEGGLMALESFENGIVL